MSSIRISRINASEFELQASLWLPRPLDEVFAFFADARNLAEITPAWVDFKIITPQPIEMKAGALIDYRIKVRGLPMHWRTEIAEWVPGQRFMDRQVIGPYRKWEHTHTFEAKEGGTLCGDRVVYAVPGGALVNRLFVQPDVTKIFTYRQAKLESIFHL